MIKQIPMIVIILVIAIVCLIPHMSNNRIDISASLGYQGTGGSISSSSSGTTSGNFPSIDTGGATFVVSMFKPASEFGANDGVLAGTGIVANSTGKSKTIGYNILKYNKRPGSRFHALDNKEFDVETVGPDDITYIPDLDNIPTFVTLSGNVNQAEIVSSVIAYLTKSDDQINYPNIDLLLQSISTSDREYDINVALWNTGDYEFVLEPMLRLKELPSKVNGTSNYSLTTAYMHVLNSVDNFKSINSTYDYGYTAGSIVTYFNRNAPQQTKSLTISAYLSEFPIYWNSNTHLSVTENYMSLFKLYNSYYRVINPYLLTHGGIFHIWNQNPQTSDVYVYVPPTDLYIDEDIEVLNWGYVDKDGNFLNEDADTENLGYFGSDYAIIHKNDGGINSDGVRMDAYPWYEPTGLVGVSTTPATDGVYDYFDPTFLGISQSAVDTINMTILNKLSLPATEDNPTGYYANMGEKGERTYEPLIEYVKNIIEATSPDFNLGTITALDFGWELADMPDYDDDLISFRSELAWDYQGIVDVGSSDSDWHTTGLFGEMENSEIYDIRKKYVVSDSHSSPYITSTSDGYQTLEGYDGYATIVSLSDYRIKMGQYAGVYLHTNINMYDRSIPPSNHVYGEGDEYITGWEIYTDHIDGHQATSATHGTRDGSSGGDMYTWETYTSTHNYDPWLRTEVTWANNASYVYIPIASNDTSTEIITEIERTNDSICFVTNGSINLLHSETVETHEMVRVWINGRLVESTASVTQDVNIKQAEKAVYDEATGNIVGVDGTILQEGDKTYAEWCIPVTEEEFDCAETDVCDTYIAPDCEDTPWLCLPTSGCEEDDCDELITTCEEEDCEDELIICIGYWINPAGYYTDYFTTIDIDKGDTVTSERLQEVIDTVIFPPSPAIEIDWENNVMFVCEPLDFDLPDLEAIEITNIAFDADSGSLTFDTLGTANVLVLEEDEEYIDTTHSVRVWFNGTELDESNLSNPEDRKKDLLEFYEGEERAETWELILTDVPEVTDPSNGPVTIIPDDTTEVPDVPTDKILVEYIINTNAIDLLVADENPATKEYEDGDEDIPVPHNEYDWYNNKVYKESDPVNLRCDKIVITTYDRDSNTVCIIANGSIAFATTETVSSSHALRVWVDGVLIKSEDHSSSAITMDVSYVEDYLFGPESHPDTTGERNGYDSQIEMCFQIPDCEDENCDSSTVTPPCEEELCGPLTGPPDCDEDDCDETIEVCVEYIVNPEGYYEYKYGTPDNTPIPIESTYEDNQVETCEEFDTSPPKLDWIAKRPTISLTYREYDEENYMIIVTTTGDSTLITEDEEEEVPHETTHFFRDRENEKVGETPTGGVTNGGITPTLTFTYDWGTMPKPEDRTVMQEVCTIYEINEVDSDGVRRQDDIEEGDQYNNVQEVCSIIMIHPGIDTPVDPEYPDTLDLFCGVSVGDASPQDGIITVKSLISETPMGTIASWDGDENTSTTKYGYGSDTRTRADEVTPEDLTTDDTLTVRKYLYETSSGNTPTAQRELVTVDNYEDLYDLFPALEDQDIDLDDLFQEGFDGIVGAYSKSGFASTEDIQAYYDDYDTVTINEDGTAMTLAEILAVKGEAKDLRDEILEEGLIDNPFDESDDLYEYQVFTIAGATPVSDADSVEAFYRSGTIDGKDANIYDGDINLSVKGEPIFLVYIAEYDVTFEYEKYSNVAQKDGDEDVRDDDGNLLYDVKTTMLEATETIYQYYLYALMDEQNFNYRVETDVQHTLMDSVVATTEELSTGSITSSSSMREMKQVLTTGKGIQAGLAWKVSTDYAGYLKLVPTMTDSLATGKDNHNDSRSLASYYLFETDISVGEVDQTKVATAKNVIRGFINLTAEPEDLSVGSLTAHLYSGKNELPANTTSLLGRKEVFTELNYPETITKSANNWSTIGWSPYVLSGYDGIYNWNGQTGNHLVNGYGFTGLRVVLDGFVLYSEDNLESDFNNTSQPLLKPNGDPLPSAQFTCFTCELKPINNMYNDFWGSTAG